MIRTYISDLFRTGFADVISGTSILGLNIYTILETFKESAFPIILATGSVILTTAMIVVQLKKARLLTQQLKNEQQEGEKLDLEIEHLKDDTK